MIDLVRFCHDVVPLPDTISDMDMSGFRLHKDDVEVTLREMANGETVSEGKVKEEDELLVLYVRHISSQFKRIKWQYKQRYFPNLSGEGRCDAVVPDAQIRIGFHIKKRDLGEDKFEPVIIVSSRKGEPKRDRCGDIIPSLVYCEPWS